MASEIVSQNKEMTQSNCVQWNLQTIGDIEVIHHIGIITLSKARWASTLTLSTKNGKSILIFESNNL